MKIIDKITYLPTYHYYMQYLKNLKNKGIDLKYDEFMKTIFPKITAKYADISVPVTESVEDSFGEEELNDFLEAFYIDFFKGDNKFTFKRAINSKIIDPTIPTNMVNIEKNDSTVYMKKYQNFSDVIKLMHEIIHIFMYNTNNPHINSEVLSRLFELIVADTIDSSFPNNEYLKERLIEHLDSLLFNLDLIQLYPKIEPVIMPYIKADYLSNELFLLYKNDPEKFIYHFNKIINSEEMLENYLLRNNILISDINISSIYENHKKMILK